MPLCHRVSGVNPPRSAGARADAEFALPQTISNVVRDARRCPNLDEDVGDVLATDPVPKLLAFRKCRSSEARGTDDRASAERLLYSISERETLHSTQRLLSQNG